MELVKVRELYRPKVNGLVAHNGLELLFSDSTRKVFHNSPDTGPKVVGFEEFSGGSDVTVKQYVTEGLDEIRERLEVVLSQKRRYRATSFNCEQAVSYVLRGVLESPQVKASITGGVLAAFLCLMAGGNARHVAAAGAAGAAVGLSISKSKLLSS